MSVSIGVAALLLETAVEIVVLLPDIEGAGFTLELLV